MIGGPIAPTIIIKILSDGQMAINVPDDKMLALAMLSIATACVQRDFLNPASTIIPASKLPPPPPNGKDN